MQNLYTIHHKKMQSIFQLHLSSIKNMKFGIIFLIIYLLGHSCSDDLEIPKDNYGMGVQFQINTPKEYLLPKNLRSQTPNECAVSEIQVLVFEGGLYKYRTSGLIANSTNTTTTFSASLKSCSSEVILYIIANANNEILANEPEVNSSESSVTGALAKSFTSTGINGNFPMFGKHVLPSGLDVGIPNTINPVNMLRSIARVDIYNEASNFQFTSVQTFRANNSIQIIPNVLADPTNPAVTNPSILTGTTGNIQTPKLNLSGNFIASQLYLPESTAPTANNQVSSATCIIVGGRFNGSTETTYYRADFNSGVAGHPFGQILRNHLYSFHITAVSGPGWSTPEEAANNAPSSITTSITNWDENTIDMSFDGNNYFGVSNRKVTLNPASGPFANIDISTNLTSYTLQWSDQNGNLTGSPSTSIQNPTFSANISPDGTNIMIQALTNNTTASSLTQYLSILAGRWKIIIEIEQLSPQAFANVYINILSIGTDIGFFGSTVYGKINAGNAGGVLPILKNPANFGPSGKVTMGGFGFDYIPGSAISGGSITINQCKSYMDQFDIIHVTWGSNPGTTMSPVIMDWLNNNPNRVLFVTRDNSSSNSELIKLLGGGVNMWGGGGTSTTLNFAGYTTENDYFTKSGPFGAVSPGAGSFTFPLADNIWMGIKPGDPYANNLVPLVVSTVSGYYILSVDVDARIVYFGDSNLRMPYAQGLTGSGTTDYNHAKLFGNLYAWAINKVILPGKSL